MVLSCFRSTPIIETLNKPFERAGTGRKLPAVSFPGLCILLPPSERPKQNHFECKIVEGFGHSRPAKNIESSLALYF